ncbi:MAG TPA: hypothetical protein VIH99_00875 [Bdellovibrionota bacterium]
MLGAVYRVADCKNRRALKTFLCLLFGSSKGAQPAFPTGVQPIALEERGNEVRRISSLQPALQSQKVRRFRWKIRPRTAGFSLGYFLLSACRHPVNAWRILRFLHRLAGKYPLYVAMRAAECLFIYGFLAEKFRIQQPNFLLISTDANPHGTAAMGIASRLGIRLVFAAHAPISAHPVRIKCGLGIFYGQRSLEGYQRLSSEIGQTLFYGFGKGSVDDEGISQLRKICICLSKDPQLSSVKNLIAQIREAFPGVAVLVRPHPQTLVSRKILRTCLAIREISVSPSIAHDLEGVSFVLAGNSTVHLDVLAEGVPSVFVPTLDAVERPPLSFLQEGLVPWAGEGADWPALQRKLEGGFRGPESKRRLHSYLNQEYSFAEFLGKLEGAAKELRPPGEG